VWYGYRQLNLYLRGFTDPHLYEYDTADLRGTLERFCVNAEKISSHNCHCRTGSPVALLLRALSALDPFQMLVVGDRRATDIVDDHAAIGVRIDPSFRVVRRKRREAKLCAPDRRSRAAMRPKFRKGDGSTIRTVDLSGESDVGPQLPIDESILYSKPVSRLNERPFDHWPAYPRFMGLRRLIYLEVPPSATT
jgi:hypothetical protein